MTAIEPRISRFESALLTALLVILICLPLCKQLIFGEPGTETIEGRPLAPRPEFSFKRGLRDFPINFEAYYNDHFGFRSALLRMGGTLGVKYANVSLSPDVIIGKEGWLFKKSGLSDDNYHGGPVFSARELEQWKRSLEYRQQWLAKRGIQFLFVIPPDKQTIYPEFMPDKYNALRVETPAQQLVGYLAAHSDVHVLSLLGPMMKAKAESGGNRLYLRQDTHWNTLGAYVGYREITGRLHEWFPALKPKDRTQLQITTEFVKGDLARMMGVPAYSAGNEKTLAPLAVPPPLLPIAFKVEGLELQPGDRRFLMQESAAAGGPRVVMLHDSYTWALIPFLGGDFTKITYLLRGDDDLKYEKALGDLVRREKPDVFIEERLERFLQEPPPDPKIIFGGDDH